MKSIILKAHKLPQCFEPTCLPFSMPNRSPLMPKLFRNKSFWSDNSGNGSLSFCANSLFFSGVSELMPNTSTSLSTNLPYSSRNLQASFVQPGVPACKIEQLSDEQLCLCMKATSQTSRDCSTKYSIGYIFCKISTKHASSQNMVQGVIAQNLGTACIIMIILLLHI